jgi:ABC-type antimicrobial peptide transport system permease subunit
MSLTIREIRRTTHKGCSEMTVKQKNTQFSRRTALLTVRGALMLTLAVLTGIGIGVLTYLQARQSAQAVIAGIAAAGASLAVFDRLIGDR